MKTFAIKVTEGKNVTLKASDTFKDLREKLERDEIDFDIMSFEIEGKPLTEDLVVSEYLDTDDKEAEDEAVEFVLPDLPESATISEDPRGEETLSNELLCRLCGIKTEDPVKIFNELGDIREKISSFIPVSITMDDQLSKHICTACLEKLETMNEFIKICKETERKLRSMRDGATKVEMREENLLVEDKTTMYKCPNCKIDLRITRAEELESLKRKSAKRVTKKLHNLRSSTTAGRRRIATRFGKSDGAVQTSDNTEDNVSSILNTAEKGKMKLRDIRKRIQVDSRRLESDALETVLFSVNPDLKESGITGEFVELDALDDDSNESDKKRGRFNCELCKGEFYSRERYSFHLELHDAEDFLCTVCKKELSTEEELWEHRRYHEKEDGEEASPSQTENIRKSTKSTCDDCGARFVLRERYEFHIERHKFGNIKKISCMICEKIFKSENILWDHYQYQHKSGERYSCVTCDKSFVKRANLNYHLKTFGHKGGKVVSSLNDTPQTENMKISDVGRPRPKITCADCGARFVLQERYEFHMERHKLGKMDVCVCNLCGRESTNENVLWDHYQYMHKRTKRYACTTCGKLFHKQSMLSRHQIKYGHKGTREIDVDTDGNTVAVDSAAFKKVIAEEVVEMKSVNCVLCGEVVWGVDPNLINDAVTCASCEGPGLSLQVDSDGAKVISRRQYHCNMCNKHFTTKDRLEYHIMRHSENMDEFVCSTCGKELSTEQALFEHYLFVHKGARPHVCELCGKSYQFKARLKEHMRSHSGERPFACEICGQRCMTNNALRSHKKTHITEKRFPCQICKKAFRKRQDLNEHLERHWKNDKTMMFPQVFSCAVCLEMFPTFRILKKHMKETHSVESQDPILTDLQPWFECEDCHEKFKHQMSLKVHRERAHEGKTRPVYHCDACNVTYKNARVLSNHIKNKHEGGKRYKCAQCGKEYNQSTSLHNHILLHTGEKPFSCEHCEMTFRTKESRDHHQRKHTGERPYKCPRCDKSFATTTQRREHRKREHDEGNTHSCPECGKICFDEHGVRSHLNTHFSDKLKNVIEENHA